MRPRVVGPPCRRLLSPLVVLLFCTCFVLASCAKRVSAPDYFRFDDNLDKATVVNIPEAHEVDAGLTIDFAAAETSPWNAQIEATKCTIENGVLVFETQGPGAVLSPEDLEINPRAVDTISIRMKVEGTDSVILSWKAERVGQFLRMGKFTILVPRPGQWITYNIRSTGLVEWDAVRLTSGFIGPIRRISQLKLSLPNRARVEVESIKLLTRRAYFCRSGVGVTQHTIRPRTESCFYTHCPGEIEYRVAAPENAYISTGLGIVESNPSVRFTMLVRSKGKTKTLFTQDVQTNREWFHAQVEMNEYGGEEVDVVFRTECDGAENVALWSNPVLYRAKVTPASQRESKSPAGDDVNVVIYLIDALRADHLEVYGYNRGTAPTISTLAGEGVKFTRCFAQDTWTKASTSSLFTGATSWLHGVHEFGDNVPNSLVTLAETLRARGYATASVLENAWPAMQTNLARGFSVVTGPTFMGIPGLYTHAGRRFKYTLQQSRDWLEQHRARKFFLYVHTMEPHNPYTPSEPFTSRFAPAAGQTPTDIDLYDAEIAEADHNLNRFVEMLKELDLYENTLLVLLADHGEAFGEHENMKWHGGSPYNELIHIPLIMRCTGMIPEGTVVKENVQIIDIAPTILDVLDVSPPGRQYQGASLLPLIAGEDTAAFEDRYIYSRGRDQDVRSVIQGNWKLLYRDKKRALYDIGADFGERDNLLSEKALLADGLFEEAGRYAKSQQELARELRADEEDLPLLLDPDTVEKLKALVYLK